MQKQKEKEEAKEVGMRTGSDPIMLAAIGSIILAWYQYYVRGNKEHGLFIGLWPPTILALGNAVRIKEISEKVESKTANLLDRLTQS
jgi:hypothetical protein